MNMIDDEFGDPASTERLFNRRHEIFDATWEEEPELKRGAAEAVAALRERGLAAALAPARVRDRALPPTARLGLRELFAAAVFDEDIEHHKPAPDVYLVAADHLDIEPARCVAVEDSFNGVRSGAAAGMRTIMVPHNNEPTPEIRAQCAEVLTTHPEGVRSGAAAGMRTIMVPDYNEPTPEIRALCAEVLTTLHELPAALDRLKRPTSRTALEAKTAGILPTPRVVRVYR